MTYCVLLLLVMLLLLSPFALLSSASLESCLRKTPLTLRLARRGYVRLLMQTSQMKGAHLAQTLCPPSPVARAHTRV